MKDLNKVLPFAVSLSILLLTSAGCQSSPQPGPDHSQKTLIVCKEPRRNICTREYRPVCGIRQDGSKHTYSNACVACADKHVTGFTWGDCEGKGLPRKKATQ